MLLSVLFDKLSASEYNYRRDTTKQRFGRHANQKFKPQAVKEETTVAKQAKHAKREKENKVSTNNILEGRK